MIDYQVPEILEAYYTDGDPKLERWINRVNINHIFSKEDNLELKTLLWSIVGMNSVIKREPIYIAPYVRSKVRKICNGYIKSGTIDIIQCEDYLEIVAIGSDSWCEATGREYIVKRYKPIYAIMIKKYNNK